MMTKVFIFDQKLLLPVNIYINKNIGLFTVNVVNTIPFSISGIHLINAVMQNINIKKNKTANTIQMSVD